MSVHIRVNKQYVITSDSRQFILNEERVYGEGSKKPGETYLQPVAFYPRLSQLLDGLVHRQIHNSTVATLDEMCDLLNRLVAECEFVMCEAKARGEV